MFSRLSNGFKHCLKNYPIPVNLTVYATFYSAAEMSQQIYRKIYLPEKPDIDYKAALKIAAVGSSIYAPTLYVWYKYLDKKYPGTAMKVVLKKVFLDQLIMTPILISIFYTTFGIIDQREDVFEELRHKFWKTFIANQTFWIPAQTVNFTFVTPRFRVIYVATASFLWINILCLIKRERHETKEKKDL